MSDEAYVVSDLHLGAGAAEPALEDFDQDEALAAFVTRIARPGGTLFLNGDFIDFPQIPPYVTGPAEHLLWDEASSLSKLRAALSAHPTVFVALAELVKRGGKLRVHVGNHDLDLAWPAVQKELRRVVGGDDIALSFSRRGSVYHGVHIEHGHMFTPENATKDPEDFIHAHRFPDGSRREYLERVWGTDFMLGFYNDLERKHPFADNVKPTLMVAYHGLKNRWVGARELVRIVLFLARSGVPLGALGSAVLAGPPRVDTVALAIRDEPWRRAIGERLASDSDFRSALTTELSALPPEQQALLHQLSPVELGIDDDELATAGATLGVFREDRQYRAAREHLRKPGITHVVFGHTHHTLDGELDGCLFNTGTWLPRLDLKRPDIADRIARRGISLDMLDDATLYVRSRIVAKLVPEAGARTRVSLVLADDVR